MTSAPRSLGPFVALAVAAGLALAAPAAAQTGAPPGAPRPETCPSSLPAGARCWSGQAASGAWWWYARPAAWNGRLVLHAHGGPRLGAPARDEPAEDLDRFAVMVAQGYAWAGSTYRRGGFGVRMAAEDTEQLRQIAWDLYGKPERTFLHGQSWGGNVAAMAAELYAVGTDGERRYDGVLLTSGILGGGSRAYGFRADLRAVYQFYCRNHPRPDEEQYPLWQGLPQGATLRRADIAARVEACTGVGAPAPARSPEQTQRLRNILAVTGIAEDQLVAHLAWATNLFADLVWNRLDGGNPFDNAGRTYRGSDDDQALNEGVERFAADPRAVAALAWDSDPAGRIVAPTITLHGRYDPTVFVEQAARYAATVEAAGRADLLVQAYTTETAHSRLSPPQYAAALEALEAWLDTGERPTAAGIAAACERLAARLGQPCFIDPEFSPAL